MKILQVVPFFTPARGGSVVVPYNLSKHLAERGHEVTIITTDFEFDKEYAESLKRVQVIPFKCIANIALFLISPSMKKWLKKNIENYDISHMHNYRPYQNIIAHHYAKKYSIPYILQAHGSVLPFFQRQRLKKVFDRFFGYRILRDASKVIAVTKTEVEQYKMMGVNEDKIETIPNGIDLSEYEDLPKKGEFRRKYSIRDDEKVVLYIGRLHKSKGIDLLVKAFADLVKELNNVRLVIVGPDDGFLSTLKKQIEDLKIDDKILLTGYVRGKLEAYRDADLFVNPRADEIFGLVVFEAIMCGTPVIVTDDCGCGELVKEANCGYLVKYEDVNSLKEKMKFTLENPEEGKEMVERGKRYITENFTWDKVIGKIEDIYSKIV